MVLFEAEHGSQGTRADVSDGGSGKLAPSVSSAHALGWALTRNGRAGEGLVWAQRSLKLGSRDAMFLFHAGITAREAGRADLAERWLSAALAPQPALLAALRAAGAARAERALVGIARAGGPAPRRPPVRAHISGGGSWQCAQRPMTVSAAKPARKPLAAITSRHSASRVDGGSGSSVWHRAHVA